ncbi:hypothetical protein BFP76_01155 [Amylibacter kogurei]|uniref:Uncharacterized protein n=2 Tax=Paramylibacter kogurei TaxID=1889778 RepID=A0A2G5K4E8_9RHOB|nr:hypothetical protein BFP76_01155 [Amylibacter kogurei]
MRKFVTSVWVVAVLGFAQATTSYAQTTQRIEPSDEQIVQELLAGEDKGFYIALAKYFPTEGEEYVQVVKRVITEKDDGKPKLEQWLDDTVDRLKSNLEYAPDASLKLIIDEYVQNLIRLQDRPELCEIYANKGLWGLMTWGEHDAPKFVETNFETHFAAMYQGQKNPVKRAATTGDDFRRFKNAFLENGGTEADLDVIRGKSKKGADKCASNIKYFAALRDNELEGGDKVRADLFWTTASIR